MSELINNMSEMMIKLLNLESNKDDHRKDIHLPHIEETTNHQNQFKCEQCDYMCKREIMLRKHSTTIHPVVVSEVETATTCSQKCPLCDHRFNTQQDFNNHLQMHLEDIKQMEPREPLDNQVFFKCKVCDFKSRNDKTIKVHLLEDIDQSLSYNEEESDPDESENKDPETKETKPYNIIDKFGADGRPLCDSDSDSDTDSS